MQKRVRGLMGMLPVLLVGTLLMPRAALAQAAQENRPLSLDVTQQPVQTALRTLFTAAGVRNFVIDPTVQGLVNLSLRDVPYSVALKQVLGAVSPPLTVDVQDGVTHIQAQKPGPTPPVVANAPLPSGFARIRVDQGPFFLSTLLGPAPKPDPFQTIGVKHYDAGVMADLATRPGGLIDVPPNFVVPANTAPTVNNVRANNILPDGVQRIYARESDNALVLEGNNP